MKPNQNQRINTRGRRPGVQSTPRGPAASLLEADPMRRSMIAEADDAIRAEARRLHEAYSRRTCDQCGATMRPVGGVVVRQDGELYRVHSPECAGKLHRWLTDGVGPVPRLVGRRTLERIGG